MSEMTKEDHYAATLAAAALVALLQGKKEQAKDLYERARRFRPDLDDIDFEADTIHAYDAAAVLVAADVPLPWEVDDE